MLVQKLVLYCLLLSLSLITIGCNNNEDVLTNENNVEITISDKALEQGKLALANEEINKALNNFRLAISEDENNVEASKWLLLVENYQTFSKLVEDQKIAEANKYLKLLKEDRLAAMIDSLINDNELQLRDLEMNKAIIDDEIDKLYLLYDLENESLMPDETYLVRGEEILSNPDILREQKIKVETFLKDATERVDKLLAIQEEEIKEAEAEAKVEKEKQAQTEQTNQEVSSVEEEETKEEKISKDEAENLVKQYLKLDDHPNLHVNYDHDNEHGDYVVQVYEVMIDDPVTKAGHTATWGWYGVDPVNGYVYDAFNY